MGFGFLLFGILLLLFWFVQSRKVTATQKWPPAPGRIMDSRLVESPDSEAGRTFNASVTYVYEVGGAQFQGNRVAAGGWTGTAKKIVQRYPAGAVVQVFYDPRKPGAAVLERGSRGLAALLVVAVAVCVAGLVITLAN